MAVKGTTATTEAQKNQIPPAIRHFARTWCDGVTTIKRYDPDREQAGCGFIVKAHTVRTHKVPDGYETRIAAHDNSAGMRIQIREQ